MSNPHNDYHIIKKYQQYTTGGQIRYIAEIEHVALKTRKLLADSAEWVLEGKIKDQLEKWDEIWIKNWQKSRLQLEDEINLSAAEEITKESREKLRAIDNILKDSIAVDHAVKWDELIDKRQFKVPNPKENLVKELARIKPPRKPSFKLLPKKPDKSDFMPKLNVVGKLFKGITKERNRKAEALYGESLSAWKVQVEELEGENEDLEKKYNNEIRQYEANKRNVIEEYAELEKAWKLQLNDYHLKQNESNLKIQALKESYSAKDPVTIVEYCKLVITHSEYPESFPKEIDLKYNGENKFIVIDCVLPAPDDLPRLTEVKYIPSKKEMREHYLSDTQFVKMYDDVIYNTVFKIIYELFQADKIEMIETIILNGWVKAINKATGKMANSCIVSIHVRKAEFMEIDLVTVDLKSCFRYLKGVGASKLFSITPVQPIIKIDKNDKRFISAYSVGHSLTNGYNLAAIGWDDFERLINDILEKEFSYNGGEFKIIRANRNEGVHAIAFDPDPIRGGKIIIQAKRNTDADDVPAIQHLYDTVLNEGATKGVLITLSDYGPDAYDFVKNKPLSLLSGSNLLYLLKKHGYKAKIDLTGKERLNKE